VRMEGTIYDSATVAPKNGALFELAPEDIRHPVSGNVNARWRTVVPLNRPSAASSFEDARS
jgi:hypothetical protein